MALTFEKVASVISQPPDNRKDFEINNLISWFRQKSDLFRSLKTELLFDLIKHLQLETKTRDDIVIQQGDKGECMYILLRGQVTIYILYAGKPEPEEVPVRQSVARTGESVRTILGTFVCSLGLSGAEDMDEPGLSPRDIKDMIEASLKAGRKVNVRPLLGETVRKLGSGATFGEVALLSDDCIRTASVITDDNSDLIVVDRELYNRSVKSVLQKEFEEKSAFIAGSPYFHNWAPKYKKQLAMALVKESVPYENVLVRQGEPVMGIYFILSGEVKLVTEPSQHEQQYPKFSPLPEVPPAKNDVPNAVNDLLKQMSVKGHRPEQPDLPSYRRRNNTKNVLELCLLGMNESVGDIEVILDLETYMQTAICTQRTEVLLLGMKHLERLLVKRNPRSLGSMKVSLGLKLSSRISEHISRQVPLLKVLSATVEEYVEQQEQTTMARTKGRYKHVGKPTKSSDSHNAFIPKNGPLINQYGPGTVFHRIRKREQAKAKRSGPSFSTTVSNVSALQGAHAQTMIEGQTGPEAAVDDLKFKSKELEPNQIDPELNSLDDRMRNWLTHDQESKGKLGLPTRSRYQASSPGSVSLNRNRTPGSSIGGATSIGGSLRDAGQTPKRLFNGHSSV